MKIQQIPQKLHWDIEVKGTPEDGIILLQTTNISTHHVHIEPASLPALASALGQPTVQDFVQYMEDNYSITLPDMAVQEFLKYQPAPTVQEKEQNRWTDEDIDAAYVTGVLNANNSPVSENAAWPSLERAVNEIKRLKATGFDAPHKAIRALRYPAPSPPDKYLTPNPPTP